MNRRQWNIGDPEPPDHPNVVSGIHSLGDGTTEGPFHYLWEPPDERYNAGYGGWWCWEGSSDLVDWEDVLREENIVTEDLEFEVYITEDLP